MYELARELGLTNKETVDLCNALGIGVKSHSSSVVEPQADRVRRKAEREGLIREHQPDEDGGSSSDDSPSDDSGSSGCSSSSAMAARLTYRSRRPDASLT